MTAFIEWAGCATFRLTVGELVVFLDAYLDRPDTAHPTGFSVDAVERADWILVGHSHVDHLWGAERIALRTGATIVGSYETVRVMTGFGVPESQLIPVAGGERIRLGPDVLVSVVPGQHSCAWTHAEGSAADTVCLGDLGLDWHQRQERWAAPVATLAAKAAGVTGVAELSSARKSMGLRGDGGPLVYLIETPDGSLLYQDTSGYWSDLFRSLSPDVAIIGASGRASIDGEPIQGSLADFVAGAGALLGSQRVLLSHHDDWLPGLTRAVDPTPIRDALAERCPRSELIEIGYSNPYTLF
jgi:L-ascorbate metabolism protein UlaG (beta-lactamase superfamily)